MTRGSDFLILHPFHRLGDRSPTPTRPIPDGARDAHGIGGENRRILQTRRRGKSQKDPYVSRHALKRCCTYIMSEVFFLLL